MNWKRVIIATILGFIAGLFCYWGGKTFAGYVFTIGLMWSTILNRTLIGFVIGVSRWKVNYLLHGAIMGAIVSLSMAIVAIDTDPMGLVILVAYGIVYGFLIELITTKVFKAGM